MSELRVLTGITTSGTPHLGNYVGAIRPAVQASRQSGVQSFYFLADYHALIKVGEPARIQRSTLEIPPPGWPPAWTRTRSSSTGSPTFPRLPS